MGVTAISKKITDNAMKLLQNVYFICKIPHTIPIRWELILSACSMKRWANIHADPPRGCNPKPHALHDGSKAVVFIFP